MFDRKIKDSTMNKPMMFEYSINILKNVSFDSALFSKELEKAMRTLLPYDVEQLIKWVNDFLIENPKLKAELDREIIEELACE